MAKMPTKSSLIVLVIWISGCMGRQQNVSPKVDLKSTTTTPKLCYRSACYLQPAKCNLEDGNCRYALSVKETSDKKSFKFNLRGSDDGFVAIGLSKDKFVGSDDMVACVLNGTKVEVKHIYGEYSRLHVTDLIEGATILKATYDRKNKIIHCVFTRKKILKSVPQYFNMKRKWYFIFASGALKKGMPLMQGPQRVTKRKVSLAKHVLYAETDIKPAGKPKTDKQDKGGTGTDPFQPPDFLKLNKCGKYEQCAKVPDNCDWNKCDISVRIKENKTGDSLTFLLAGKSNGWIALAFSEDKKMNEDDVVFCIRGKTEGRTDVKQAYSARHYMEEITSPDNLMVHSSSYVDGYISCKFTRKKNIPENDKTFNLYRPHYMFLGYGPITSSIHRPMQHSVTPVISEYMVNFNSTRGVITMADGSDEPDGVTGPLPFGAWTFDIDEDSGLPASQEFVDPPNLQLIPDKAVISYKPTVPSTYMKYVRALSMFLPDSSAHATCNPATKFGYASGCPCVIVTFTGNPKEWAPLPYPPMLMPTTIKDVYVDSHLPLTCEGKTNADKRILGSVVVTPSAGFLSDDLVNSFVTVQLMSPVEDVSIRIVCFTWAANIDHSRSEGRIDFTVKIKGSAKH